MRLICTFRPCDWHWHFNAGDKLNNRIVGVYQCYRCKTISVGSPRRMSGSAGGSASSAAGSTTFSAGSGGAGGARDNSGSGGASDRFPT